MDLQQSIINAIRELSSVQQEKLLEFIYAMLRVPPEKKEAAILQFAGIFDETDREEFETALKDCEQIDENEW